MNKSILNFVITILIGFSVLSCKQAPQEIKTEENITQIDSFDYKLKNEPKIFLKYWTGMTYEEYIKVSDILSKEGKIIEEDLQEYYNLGDTKIKIEPFTVPRNTDDIFVLSNDCGFNKKDEKYDGILLRYVDTTAYEVFKSKYKLQKLIKRQRYLCSLNENKPTDILSSHGKMLKIYNQDSIANIIENYMDKYFTKGYPFIPSMLHTYDLKVPIVKYNENTVLIFETVNAQCKERDMEFLKKESYKDFNDAKKDAKTVICLSERNPENVILYLSKETYENYLKRINNEELGRKKLKEEKNNKLINRKAESLNEI